jgi:hypothetical protein
VIRSPYDQWTLNGQIGTPLKLVKDWKTKFFEQVIGIIGVFYTQLSCYNRKVITVSSKEIGGY